MRRQPGADATVNLWQLLDHRVSRTPDKVLPRISEYGGHVIETSLSHEDEDHLRDALGEHTSA